MTEPHHAARDRLLDRTLEYLVQTGIGESSLREIAAGVGTSHRMLIYHFGSRSGLLAEVVLQVEERQRELLGALIEAQGDLVAVCRTFWRRVSAPELAAAERFFFEIYTDALYARPWTEPFRESVISTWQAPLTALFRRHGFTKTQAVRRSRLALAVARGLLLDLLITEDRRATDAAADLFAELIAAPP